MFGKKHWKILDFRGKEMKLTKEQIEKKIDHYKDCLAGCERRLLELQEKAGIAPHKIDAIDMILANNGVAYHKESLAISEELLALRENNVSWQYLAYAKLGAVRDAMTPEHVEIVQNFIGEIPKEGNDNE